MANSKQEILRALRKQKLSEAPLPSLEGAWITYDDPIAHFAETVQSVGGQCERMASYDELKQSISERPEYVNAKRCFSAIPDVGKSNVDIESTPDPHQLEDVDFAIFPGHFGVAENGAVWVTDESLRHRVIYFIAQHIALVVPASEIVHNLHQAYERMSIGENRFGVFISGPSKTADIEQSLVIGAHGARSLVVYLVD